METEIDFQAVAYQLQEENEKLREQITKHRKVDLSIEKLKHETSQAFQSPYFWIGYFLAIVVVSLIHRLEDK